MPIIGPGGVQQFQISDLVPEVLIRTENRQGTANQQRAAIWLRDSLLELTSDPQLRNEFDELEVYGPQFDLSGNISVTATVQEYNFDNLIVPGDYNMNTLDILLWTDPPTNSNRIRLIETSYQAADKVSPYPGQPAKWYRFNNLVGFVPPPDQDYTVQARLYRMHPIADAVEQTIILIGRNWNEILVWAAVMRGYAELEQYEKSGNIKAMIYGDPKYPDRVGLLEGRKKRHEKEAWRQQRSLRPVVRRYSKPPGM